MEVDQLEEDAFYRRDTFSTMAGTLDVKVDHRQLTQILYKVRVMRVYSRESSACPILFDCLAFIWQFDEYKIHLDLILTKFYIIMASYNLVTGGHDIIYLVLSLMPPTRYFPNPTFSHSTFSHSIFP